MLSLESDLETGIIDSLKRWEGNVPWMYCDFKGYVTVGIGNLLPTTTSAAKMRFVNRNEGNRKASEEEIEIAWTKVRASFAKDATACFYKDLTQLRLDADFAENFCLSRLREEFFPAVASLFHGFRYWPKLAKIVVVDMFYSLGIHGISKYPNFLESCQRGDFISAAEECIRGEPGKTISTASKGRNRWAIQSLLRSGGLTTDEIDARMQKK